MKNKKLAGKRSKTYELWSIEEPEALQNFEGCKTEFVAAWPEHNSACFVYYKRYKGDEFYRLDDEELEWLLFQGEEIPF